MKKAIKFIKTTICTLLLIIGGFLIFGECESMEQQIYHLIIGLGCIILDTYLWQWFGMGKYYDKYLEMD